MSTRFPAIPMDGSNPIGDAFEAAVKTHHGANPNFRYKDSKGSPIGPFGVLAYAPDTFGNFMTFGADVLHQPGSNLFQRELMILATYVHNQAAYIRYAHSRIALRAGMTPEQIEDCINGVTPKGEGIGEKEVAMYEYSLALAKCRGPLPDEDYDKAFKVLGQEMCARIAVVVGSYLLVGTLLNAGAVPEPEEES